LNDIEFALHVLVFPRLYASDESRPTGLFKLMNAGIGITWVCYG
jgi:hypothetical protein